MHAVSPEMLAYFWILLENKLSILIAGGTASGKTTLLNALAFFIPPESRVVSIEDTREINLPRENWLPAVSRTSIGVGKLGEVDLFALLRSSFRQTPDYLIVGEVRGKEAFVLFQGMASGHASISTMHADSVDTLIRRLQTPPIELPPTLVNTLDCVAIASHAVVGQHETRRLREIVEIVKVNKDGTAIVNTPMVWDPTKDEFFFKKQSKVFEKISARKGVTVQSLHDDFKKRTELLYRLYLQKVFDFDTVGKIINDYYKSPADVLAKYGVGTPLPPSSTLPSPTPPAQITPSVQNSPSPVPPNVNKNPQASIGGRPNSTSPNQGQKNNI
jgi:flagellar protein FlaI